MALYATPEQHAANPPSTWTVCKVRHGVWHVRDRAGSTIERATTRREAERLRTEGSAARLWDQERRWYAGEAVAGWRPYADVAAERARLAARWGR